MPRVVMGSVKKITVMEEPSDKKIGHGFFEFTDDYSVFDYGKMPDVIPGKGESLCRMSAYNFEHLAKLGVKSHFRRLVSGTKMEVDIVRILYPGKDKITHETTNYLVPLEVVFRNSLPSGSSVFKRLESGQISLEQLGLKEMPKPGAKLKKPIIDFATKLEPTDRHLDEAEAKSIAALTDDEFAEIKKKALKVDEFLTKHAESKGIEHADGKVEFVMNSERELMLGDVVGTADENRFLCKGVQFSKQAVRDYYNLTTWPGEVKKAFAENRALLWQSQSAPILRKAQNRELPKPKPLPKELIAIVSDMYKSLCETWTGQRVWGAPKPSEVVERYSAFMEKAKAH